MCSDAPDTSGMNAAAVASAAVSKEALDFYKQQYAESAPARDKQAAQAYEVADQQLKSSKANDALAADYADYNKTTFRPLEQSIVADAEAYDTPEKRQAAVDAGLADTNRAFAQTNEATARTMAANGINPGSARAMSVMQGQGVDQAVANAGAAYNARKGVETVGYARKMDAASLGRGLASSQATSAQVALTAGNNSVANTGVPLATANQATQTMGQGFNTAIQGQQVAGNLYGQAAQLSSQDSGLMGTIGQLGGAAISAYSDQTLKTDIETASPDEALAEVTNTPVKHFKYDPAKLAARGIDQSEVDPGVSTGPMAQDVNANMGEAAAPKSEKINLVTLNGKNMLAIQALNKKVDTLASMIKNGQMKAGATA